VTSLTAIADLHGNLPEELPAADVLVIAGDVCPISDHATRFQAEWLESQLYPWMERLPFEEVVWIAGNHDFVCQEPGWTPGGPGRYLLDERHEACGISLYGTPWVPDLEGWAFYADDASLAARMTAIPSVDVVVSHGPPRGHGDRTVSGRSVGSQALVDRLAETEPRLCVFGHIHEDHGSWSLGPTALANVSHVDERYRPRKGAAMRFELGT
jgi:Icc-related predicted phosphoesterase